MITAEITANAPDNTTGIKSQIKPLQPPAIVRAPIVPTVPTPRIVATTPATDVFEAASLIVLFAIACSSIAVNNPRNDPPTILLISTARTQMMKLRLTSMADIMMRGSILLMW